MTGGAGGGGGAAANPFAPPPMAGAGGDDDTGLKIKAFLEGAGIPFDDAKARKLPLIMVMAAEIAKRAIVVTLTQAEYDALSPPDENTLYLIT